MTDLRDLLNSQPGVAVFPDPETSSHLEKMRAFWSGQENEGVEAELDLSALADAEIEERLVALGITDTELPPDLRALVAKPPVEQRWEPKLAIAACLLVGIALGALGIPWRKDTPAAPTPDQIATGVQEEDATPLDPYLILNDDPTSRLSAPEETDRTLRTVRLPGAGEDLDLNRIELRELQSLLNRFGYGPVPELGLPSDDTDAAIARFRVEHDLVEGGADAIVLALLRERARQAAIQELKKRSNPTSTPKEGDQR